MLPVTMWGIGKLMPFVEPEHKLPFLPSTTTGVEKMHEESARKLKADLQSA